MSNSAVPARPQRRGLKGAIIAVGLALLASIVAFAMALSGLISIPGITQASGEVVLQGVDEAGRDPFSDTALASVSTGSAPQPVVAPAKQVSGGSVGLYGGTGDNSRCDPAQLVSFLGANPAKAQAWVAALNADPNLRWGNNQPLKTSDIPAYVSQLTSLVLLTDTLVTNHGYSNGSATPFQAVLQAGTAVLVDRYGVPRTRCFCGNPLIPATTLAAKPTVTGTPWPGFAITNVVNIVNVVNVINVFQVVPYPAGGTPIAIPAGLCDPNDPSTCGAPGPAGFTPTTAPTAAPTSAPSAAPVPADWTPIPPSGAPASPTDTTTPTTIEFVNASAKPIDVYWIDFSGAPIYYATLAPGESYVQSTTEGHVWAITSGSPTPLSLESAPASPSTFTIR